MNEESYLSELRNIQVIGYEDMRQVVLWLTSHKLVIGGV